MNRWLVLPAILCLATSLCALQPAAAPPNQAAASDAPEAAHAVVPVRLSKALDSKKARPGDAVVGATTATLRNGEGALVPSGSKVLGHVTEASASAKGDAQSSLGFVFDRIEVAGGKELKIHGTLQAVAPAEEVDTGGAGSGTIPQFGSSGAGSTMAPTAPLDASANSSNKDSGNRLNAQSRGVVGFRNLEMGVDSLLTSDSKEIKLNSGTRLMLKVQFE
ncbi:MAG TPA: hypothetical protein VFB04_01995 [Terriglobales bacterium]|nr:hypothetical protein [Terriglobales bacterium]